MSKRDTILVAALINAFLLSLLFFTANRPPSLPEAREQALVEQSMSASEQPHLTEIIDLHTIAEGGQEPIDEVDRTLVPYLAEEQTVVVTTPTPEVRAPVITPAAQQVEVAAEQADYTQVVVKRGDVLEKIARANGTTVREIMKLNQLRSDRLQIGQVLKVPARRGSTAAEVVAQQQQPGVSSGSSVDATPQYYTLKVGDSPWKVARQFHINFEDLLRLNDLDEEKARKLQVGDQIRIK